jgi:hypothetical protein
MSFAKFKYKYPENAEFCADFKTVEKNAKLLIKSYRQKKWKHLEFALFFFTKMLKFSANNFFQEHLLPII